MRANLIAGVVALCAGAFAIWGALHLPIGRPSSPEPGFVPLVEGFLLAFVGLWLIAESVTRSFPEKIAWPSGDAKRMVFHVSAVMLAYLVLMPFVGFGLSTFFFLAIAIKAWRRYSTPAAILYAALIALVIYVTFGAALNMPLPRGPYGLP